MDKLEAQNGMIKLDSELAQKLGFTSDKFVSASYLWLHGNTIVISFIWARQKGAFRNLIEKIEECGYDFKIPTPCPRMMEIAEKQGWVLCEDDEVTCLARGLKNWTQEEQSG